MKVNLTFPDLCGLAVCQTFDYMGKILEGFVEDDRLMKITDFFEFITYASSKKVMMLEQNPSKIMDMLVWMTEGYLQSMQMKGLTVSASEIEKESDTWVKMFKQLVYKEEFR